MKITDPNHPQIALTARVLTLLDRMNNRGRAAFGASCAERLYPLYEAFSRDARWGDPARLKTAIADLWAVVGGQMETGSFADPMGLLEVGPVSAEHSSPLTFAAQHAVSCVIHAWQSTTAETSDEAAWCSIVNRDCMYEYLDYRATSRSDIDPAQTDPNCSGTDWFDHPLMRSEVKKQLFDLARISKISSITPRLIQQLRTECIVPIDPQR